MSHSSREFVRFAINHQVLCFGDFTTKAGRASPYFFNAGLFYNGESVSELGNFYAHAITKSGIPYDMVFGPAYKGIPLVTTVAISLGQLGRNVNFSFNRKESKQYGEGGLLIGAPIAGRVLIVDDVISAGTSICESVEIILSRGATLGGVVIALDRLERGSNKLSAVQEVEQTYKIPVISIANLNDIVDYLKVDPKMERNLIAIEAYRKQYGVSICADS